MHTFQIILFTLFAVILISLISYGIYCKRKARFYMRTDRMAEIEEWLVKSTISWLATFGLTMALIVSII
ncbi:hypothetical protein FFF34_010815 [Inquilinus sp. KBS0705]|nr:hypothetical protein FFF34_010815 [Inquilinus sp. KBS0705]